MNPAKSDDQLLAECEVDTFRSSGPGGQNVNKRDTAVRLTHLPSGIVVTAQEERSQFRNKSVALEKLRRRLRDRARRPRPRVATKPSRRAKEKRIEQKKHRSTKKQLRRPPRSREE